MGFVSVPAEEQKPLAEVLANSSRRDQYESALDAYFNQCFCYYCGPRAPRCLTYLGVVVLTVKQ
jgi:hypothetical protein